MGQPPVLECASSRSASHPWSLFDTLRYITYGRLDL